MIPQVEDAGFDRAIAIVGIGCRFPGGVSDVAGFWQLLSEGRDAIGEIPADRMDVTRYFDPGLAVPGRMSTRWGGYLDRISELDAGFFGLSPLEAERMDPQHRLLLETAWEAIEDAGLDAAALEGSRSGVFVGQWLSDFESRLFDDPAAVDFYMTLGSGRYAASGRLSYFLGLRGPSVTLDTACSSSLAAVHLAVQSLRSGESELALAGAANVILQPHITIAYSQSRMMAPDGRCKFGDAGANGYVRSEGAAVLVLKPLRRALADGDSIHAVIRGTALNNDGRSSGSLGTPSRLGQEELLRVAYRDAGLDPGAVGYVEAHGTGTLAGDPVEIGALGRVLGEGRAQDAPLLVGSVKTNIGHTEGAAGAAGLIKAALAVKHGVVPASLHCTTPSPAIPWSQLPCRIARGQVAWPESQRRRVAGVSAFGIAGTNVHVVVEAPPRPEARPASAPAALHVLPISASSPQALRDLAGRYAALLVREPAASLADVCWSAAVRRTALDSRAAFVAANAAGMVDLLQRFAGGEEAAATARADAPQGRPRLAFVMPGQGGQWEGMARELLSSEPVFREAIVACDAATRDWCDWSILGVLEAEPAQSAAMLERIDVVQPVLVALAIGYAALLRDRGIVPDAVVGHSMGEVAAAHIAGALDLRSAMRVICRRSALMRATSGAGAMALLDIGEADAQRRLAGLEDRIAVAAINSVRSTVVSGEPAAVAQVMAGCERDGIYTRLVKVDVASHSPQMQPVARALAAELADLHPAPPAIAMYSTVEAGQVPDGALGAGYWARNVRQPVRFAAAISAMVADGIPTFVELGPHPVLLHAVEQIAQSLERPVATLACGRRDESEPVSLAGVLARAWAQGHRPDWRRVMPAGGRYVPLPLYPWQRERHWVGEAELCRGAAADRRTASPRLDRESAAWLYRLDWERSDPPPRSAPAGLGRRWLVVGDDADSAAALARALAEAGAQVRATSLAAFDAALAAMPDVAGVAVLAGPSPAAYLPVEILQAMLRSGGATPRLWFLTQGAQAIGAAAGDPSLDGAALWGAARVVGEEHPELWGGLIDLDPSADLAGQATAVARHLQSPDGEDQLAWRGDDRFVLRLVRNEAASRAADAPPWRQDATYLITGGFGGIALLAAEAMARDGARRLVLLGRTPLPERAAWAGVDPASPPGRRIAAVRRLEALGVAVHVAAVDVGDEAQLTRFLAAWQAEGWPPIRGVVHAAVALENGLAATMDRDGFERVLRSKLGSACLIDRLLPDLDILVLFSSMAGFLPHIGIANYAAANAGLDALAAARTARGRATLAIAWGPWHDTGLHAHGSSLSDDFGRQGIASLEPERGLRLYAHLAAGCTGAHAVLSVDWQRYRASRTGRDMPLVRRLAGSEAAPSLDGTAAAGLASLDARQRKAALEALVRDAVARTLRIAPDRLDARKAFGSLGLTSLLAMELRNRLEAALRRPLPATLAWNHPTVEALASYLGALVEPPAAASNPPADAAAVRERAPAALNAHLHEIASLSDDDALAALRGR
ncbi:MAG: SDR family NAD(P)-dependent oxidoreductase [Hyphomicrobiaceae bacterium]|nr:SDR family NAD(P)-dependent oxidoreductase [Hyphomicrobiaceae bacterium]